MIGIRRTFCLCLLLVLVITTHAVSQLYDTRLLSSNNITALCQDKQGYIWIGTEYGLNKFDGAHVKQYFNDDTSPQSLSDDIVRCLMTDRDGGVWVVTNRGVQRYNRATDGFENVEFSEGTAANVNDILQTPDGRIWILSAKAGVLEVGSDMKAKPLEAINKHVKRECSRMYLDKRGRLWIAYGDAGMQMFDTKTSKSLYFDEMSPDAKHASYIIEDAEGRLVVLTLNSLLCFNEKSRNFEKIVSFPSNHVRFLYLLDNGHLLFGTFGSGLWEIDPKKREVGPMANSEQLMLKDKKVSAVMKDRDGNLWVGCVQFGLLKISDKPTIFRYLPLSSMENGNGNVLRAVGADREGNIMVFQEKGGITFIDKNGRSQKHWMQDNTVMTVYEDHEGSYWVGTFRKGLFHIDRKTGKEEWMPQTGTQRIGSITQDRQGNLYTAVFSDGLRSYTPDGKNERVLGKGQLKLANKYLNILFSDSEGYIWIGHYYGIDVYDPKTDRLIDVAVDPALRPAIVYAIGQSADGMIWIGSSKGLFRYNKKGGKDDKWKRFTTRDGLPNNNICGLVINGNDVWVSTYRGLGKISSNGSIDSYFLGNGLQEWSYLRCAYAHGAKGEIVLGNQNGITWFLPEDIGKGQFEEGIMLTGMRLGNVDVNTTTQSNGKSVITGPLDTTDEISVSYLENTFSLQFSTMDYRDAQNVFYEYRFEDEPDGVWHRTAAGVSEIFLSKLSVGTHHLQVRACDNGVSSVVKTLTIRVTPPWYRSWWAYMLYLLLALMIVALWWRSYWNKRQAETNEEKIKFFVDISHELRSPLTLIKSPLEQLMRDNRDPASVRALRNMERSTNRLLTLTNQILSIRKIEKGQMMLRFAEVRLGDFIADICHDYDYQLEQRQLNLTFDNQASEMMVWIDPDQFDKVITNLIGNAIKYVEDGGEIIVTLRQTADAYAEMSICDNGPGIDEAQLKKVFERFYQTSARPAVGQMSYGIGLNLTQKIVSMHGGTITARNRDDSRGSEFTVRLPLGCKHLPQEQLFADETQQPQLKESKAEKEAAAEEENRQRIRRKTDYHVVVVDDDADIRNFLQTELGSIYHVRSYSDGAKALEGITDSLPDIVISDVKMPNMDGMELLKRVKSNTDTYHVPVILLTTKTDHDSRISGIEKGADAYIDKPFNLEELEAVVASLIANRQRVRGKYSTADEMTDGLQQIELKGNDATLMERIKKSVNSRLDDSDFNVETLAEDVGLSRTQLHRRMKELTGISVGEYIRNLRLQQAAKLLQSGDVNISQVTYAVGFSTPAHFTVAFKKYYGITPSEYMTKHAILNIEH